MEIPTGKKFRFADFELDVTKRLLFSDGKPLPLNSKTFDLLLTLVEHRGQVLTKDELLEKVWAGQFVEEGNLKVQVRALRKLFDEKKGENRFIATVPGRGYSFVAELEPDEIVLESHRLSRILVDDFGAIPQPADEDVQRHSNFGRLKQFRTAAVAGAILTIAVLTIGSVVFWRVLAVKDNAAFKQMSIRKLTTNGKVVNATLSPDGKLFAYSISEGGLDSLWLGHVDGGEPIQLRPPDHVIYLSLRFAPDGSSIYYTSSENYDAGALYRMPVFGGAAEKIRDNFRNLAFSPDGNQFAFIRTDEKTGEERTLSIADANGNIQREITLPSSDTASGWHSPAWSTDGTIALAASLKKDEAAIFMVNLDDGSTRRLTQHAWRVIGAQTWLPNGGLATVAVDKNAGSTQLWYVSSPSGEVQRVTNDLNPYGMLSSAKDSLLTVQGLQQSNIWIAPADDLNGAKQITFGSPGQDNGWSGLAWTPDGRIIYTADTTGGTDIFIMNGDGKNQRQLVPSNGINNILSVTADGRYLVFQSNRSGNFEVWRSEIDSQNMAQLTGNGVAGEPDVSPDGKWIAYVTDSDGNGELRRISIDGGEPVRLSDHPASWPRISPDSSLIACGMDFDGKTKLALLPIDGGEPIKTFDLPRLANLRFAPRWTPDGQAVTYRDWSNGIWKQDIVGGPPQRLGGLPEEKLFNYGWSADGKQFAFTRGASIQDVVLLENLPK
jgi:Tol biopolymer transport system component/DNA-binding winged helix-turn-helix (wHTH) protein